MKITKKILKEMIEEAIEEGNNSGYGDGKRKAVEIRRAYKSGKREEPTKEELLSIIQSATDGKSADYAQMYKLAFDMVWSATLTGPVVSKGQLPFANARDSKAARGSNQQSGRNPLYTLEESDMPDLTPGMVLASDVVRVKDAMGNIDNKDEYTQLLTLVLKMSGDISGAEEILRQAMKQLPEFVAQLDGQIDE